MVILTTIYVIAAVLLLFGAAIFVHEWGHYFVARMCGMKVEEFAIGFGKILWKREKDGILYTVRAIPAGGFVKRSRAKARRTPSRYRKFRRGPRSPSPSPGRS